MITTPSPSPKHPQSSEGRGGGDCDVSDVTYTSAHKPPSPVDAAAAVPSSMVSSHKVRSAVIRYAPYASDGQDGAREEDKLCHLPSRTPNDHVIPLSIPYPQRIFIHMHFNSCRRAMTLHSSIHCRLLLLPLPSRCHLANPLQYNWADLWSALFSDHRELVLCCSRSWLTSYNPSCWDTVVIFDCPDTWTHSGLELVYLYRYMLADIAKCHTIRTHGIAPQSSKLSLNHKEHRTATAAAPRRFYR